MTTRKIAVSLAVAALLVIAVEPAGAMLPVQARDLSMGMAQAAEGVGVQVVGYNPAFLGFHSQPSVTFSFPVLNLGFRFGNNSWSNDDINTYFEDGKVWTDEDRADIIGKLADDKLAMTSDLFIRAFGVSFPAKYLNVAITYDVGMSVDTRLDDELLRLAINGNPIEKLGVQRTFEETKASMLATSRIGLTFAKNFKYAREVDWLDELTAGATFHYYIGHAFLDVAETRGDFMTDYEGTTSHAYFEVVGAGQLSNDESHDFYSDDPTAGSGVGLDLGIGGRLLDGRATVGFSIVNLVNQMSWSGGTRHIYAYDLEGLPLEGMDGGQAYVDSNFVTVDSAAGEDETLSTSLPRLFHLNGSYLLTRRLSVTGGLTFQTNDVVGADAFARAGFGAEWRGLRVLPLRAGMSFGGRSGVAFGAGFGLHFGFWQTDFGIGWESGLFDGAKGMRLGLSSIFVFGARELKEHRITASSGD